MAQEAQPIGKILETAGLKTVQSKPRYSEWDWVVLTDEEKEDALGYRRMLKGSHMQEEEKKENARKRIIEAQSAWTYDQLKADIMQRVKQEPFDFVIDEFNERVIHLLCLYFTNDERFDLEEITYPNGEKRKLSLKKGIGLISAKKGTGKTILMKLFQQNKRMPYLQIETKDVAAMYKKEGERAIELHSDLLHVPPLPTFYYHSRIGICFGDLGNEIPKGNWGDKSDVMADVLHKIYNKGQEYGDFSPFHFTSNLSGIDFEHRYGDRIKDRLREMFNVIILPGESRRK